MTVSNTNITTGPYTGNGLVDTYDYDFKIFDESEIRVFETDDSGTETELTLTTDFTVTGVGVDGGGTVTRVAGNLPTGYTWYMRSNITSTQETDLESQGGFFPDVHEDAFDKLTLLLQQVEDLLTRSVRLSDSDTSGADLELPAMEASKLIGTNAAGDGLTFETQQSGGVIEDASVTLAKLANLANSRAIGRNTAGTGVPEAVTIEQMLNWFASIAQGDILFRGASGFERLAAGTAGYLLQTGGAGADPSYVNASPVGDQSVWIPAGAFVPTETNGAAWGSTETTTNKIMLQTLDFDEATEEHAQVMIRMPKSWDEGTITAYFLWSNASGTGDVVWGIEAVALSDDDALDAAFGTAVTVTDSVTAAGDLMQSAETSAVTIAGTPAEGDLVVFQAFRKAADAADTLAVDARLHGVMLIYTTDVGRDN